MEDPKRSVECILTSLETLPPFRYEDYNAAVQAAMGLDKAEILSPATAELLGEHLDDALALDRFKVETIASDLTQCHQWGFSDALLQEGLQLKLATSASRIVYVVYRQYLEDHLGTEIPHLDLPTLVKDHDFCYAWIHRLMEPSSIASTIQRFACQPHYCEALGYLYERMRPKLKHMRDRFVHDHYANQLIAVSDLACSSLPGILPLLPAIEANPALGGPDQLDRLMSTLAPVAWADTRLFTGPHMPRLGEYWAARWAADSVAKEVLESFIEETDYVSLPLFPGSVGGDWYTATEVVHGDHLWQWMLHKSKSGYSDIFHAAGPENSEIEDPLASCFSPDTMIFTDHGPVEISMIGTGTRVLTKPPLQYGITSQEIVIRETVTGKRNIERALLLYGFNGERPFVTAGHIFFTSTGPKALDPRTAQAENPGIHVTKLKVGDAVYRLNAEGTDCIEVPICSVNYERASCSTVHGLHFARGANGGRYFANSWWVGENYPDITIHSLLTRFAVLTSKEQRAFVHTVRNLPHTFRQVFGSVIFDTFRNVFTHDSLHALPFRHRTQLASVASIEHAAVNDITIKQLVATFRLVSAAHLADRKPLLDSTHPRYHRMVDHINEGTILPVLTVFNGAVLCDGKPVDNVTMSHLSLRWSRRLPEGPEIYEHGALRLIAHGRAVVGILGRGRHVLRSPAELGNVHHFFALADANEYELVTSRESSPSPKAAEEEPFDSISHFVHFWKIRVGLAKHQGGVVLKVAVPDLDDEYEHRYASGEALTPLYSVAQIAFGGEYNILAITVKVTPGLEDVLQTCLGAWTNTQSPGPAFESFTVHLNLQTNELRGHFREIIDDDVGNYTNGAVHALFSLHSDTLEASHAMGLQCVRQADSEQRADHTATVHDPSRLFHGPAPAGTRELLKDLFSGPSLTLTELQTTDTPDDGALYHLAHTYLQQAAIYWRDPPEVDLLGDHKRTAKHIVPASFVDQVDARDRAFLAEYDRALVMWSLARSSAFVGFFSDAERQKLWHYWHGSSSGCLAQSPTFNKLWKMAVSESFVALTPALQCYLKDKRDWAQDLFTLVTSNVELNAQAFAMFQWPERNPTRRYCNMLSALDKHDRDFEDQLWHLVRDKIVLRPSVGTITTKADDWCGFAVNFTRRLIDRVETGPRDAVMNQVELDLKELVAVMFTSSAEDLAGALFGDGSPLGQCMITAIRQTDDVVARNGLANFGTLMCNYQGAMERSCSIFAGAKPHLTGFCALAIQGFAIYASLSTSLGWGELTEDANENAILATLEITMQACREVGPLLAEFREIEPSAQQFQDCCARWNEIVGPQGPELSFQELAAKVNPEAPPGSSLHMQMAVAASDSRIMLEDVQQTFGFDDYDAASFVGAATVLSAMCLALDAGRVMNRHGNTDEKDLFTIAKLCTKAQLISGACKPAIAIPGLSTAVHNSLGSVVAVSGVLSCFAEPAERSTSEIRGPLESYLGTNKASFFDTLPVPTTQQLEYRLYPSELLTSKRVAITLHISGNKQHPDILVKSVTVHFTAGVAETHLFAKPHGDDGMGNPTEDTLHATLFNGHEDFRVAYSKLPGTVDHEALVQIQSLAEAGGILHSEGLTLSIIGTTQIHEGWVNVYIAEVTDVQPFVSAWEVYKIRKCSSWLTV